MKPVNSSFLSVHPHVGYQNTSFAIFSNYDNVKIKITPGDEYVDFEENIAARRKFSPGKYTLCAIDETGAILQEDAFLVENAIKEGGGTIKKEIVLKSWVVMIMSDRTYFYNRLDKRDFFEFAIHPDNIKEVTSDILLFDNSVFFSMSKMAIVVECCSKDIIYYSDKILIYEEGENIFFFNYERCIQVLSDVTKYVYDNVHQKLFVYQKSVNRIRIVDLTDESYEGELYKILFVPKDFEFLNDGHCIVQDEYDDFYLCSVPDDYLQKIPFDSIKAYFNIGENAQFSFSHYNKRFDISAKDKNYKIKIVNTTLLALEIEEDFFITHSGEHKYSYFLLLNGDDFIQIANRQLYDTNDYIIYGSTSNNIVAIYNKRNNAARSVNNVGIHKYENDYYYCSNNSICNLDGTEFINGVLGIEFSLFRDGIVLKREYQSDKKCYYQLCDGVFKPLCEDITYTGNSVFKDEEDSYYYVVKGEMRKLPEKLFELPQSSDVEAVINSIETGIDKGDCLLIKNLENKWLALEWSGEKYISREVFLEFKNDYYNEVLFTTNNNELLCKMKDKTFCLYNTETNLMQKLPHIEDSPASFIVNAYSMVAEYDLEREEIVFKDPMTLKVISQTYLKECCAGSGGDFKRGYSSLDGRYSASLYIEAKRNYYPYPASFKIIDNYTDRTIYIKGNCRSRISYINYISFSPDSRYMAIAGATPSTGYFMLYDIEEEKIIGELYPSRDKENVDSVLSWGSKERKCSWGESAIWIAMFNKDNDVALYTSIPKTCLFSSKENYEKVEIISKRSLLCFSPSGKYYALSKRGYIAYCQRPSKWGHQKSVEVYVRRTDKSGKEMGPFTDLQEEHKRTNIGMATFSLDERRLLMISDDGCFVVRNLDIENDEEWHDVIE